MVSVSTLTNDQMTLFIHGSREKQAGYRKVGIADLSHAGCTSTVSFHKQWSQLCLHKHCLSKSPSV